MPRDYIPLPELLRRHSVDLSLLEPAPADPSDRELSARVRTVHHKRCVVCGEGGATARVHVTSEHGPRWVDLCWGHGTAVTEPSPGMPESVEGILADVREALAEAERQTGVRAPLSVWTDETGWQDG